MWRPLNQLVPTYTLSHILNACGEGQPLSLPGKELWRGWGVGGGARKATHPHPLASGHTRPGPPVAPGKGQRLTTWAKRLTREVPGHDV